MKTTTTEKLPFTWLQIFCSTISFLFIIFVIFNLITGKITHPILYRIFFLILFIFFLFPWFFPQFYILKKLLTLSYQEILRASFYYNTIALTISILINKIFDGTVYYIKDDGDDGINHPKV